MTTAPVRIQRRRTKGWRTPDNAVIVTRPSRFGNPFTLAMAYELGYARPGDTEQARKAVVGAFTDWLRGNRSMWQSEEGDTARRRILEGLPELHGKNLACYCPEGQPCHADVLLELSNATIAFVISGAGSGSHHLSAGCKALDSVLLHAGPGRLRITTVEQAAAEQRPPCLVCAAPAAEEWIVTPANCGQLWELVEHPKPHYGPNSWPDSDGLTIRPASSATGEQVVARFGDTIRRCPDGRYAVTPATTES